MSSLVGGPSMGPPLNPALTQQMLLKRRRRWRLRCCFTSGETDLRIQLLVWGFLL